MNTRERLDDTQSVAEKGLLAKIGDLSMQTEVLKMAREYLLKPLPAEIS